MWSFLSFLLYLHSLSAQPPGRQVGSDLLHPLTVWLINSLLVLVFSCFYVPVFSVILFVFFFHLVFTPIYPNFIPNFAALWFVLFPDAFGSYNSLGCLFPWLLVSGSRPLGRLAPFPPRLLTSGSLAPCLLGPWTLALGLLAPWPFWSRYQAPWNLALSLLAPRPFCSRFSACVYCFFLFLFFLYFIPLFFYWIRAYFGFACKDQLHVFKFMKGH